MFGEYTLEARLHPAIWVGQKKESTDRANVCIKMVTVPEFGDRDITTAQHLLLSAAVQQAISQHSMRWAPVLHLGSDGIDSFYIIPRYPRSLQTLIDQRLAIDAEQLKNIMLEILEGLIDLRHTYNQSHGNLKPSNVFLTSPSDIGQHCLRLSDPDGTADTIPLLTRSFDVRSMGQILYALVTFKDHTTAHFPVTDFHPWKRLGSSSKKWFELCNQMLDSPAHPGLEALSKLRTQIGLIKIPRRRSLMSVFFF